MKPTKVDRLMAEKVLRNIGYTTVYEDTQHLALNYKDLDTLTNQLAQALVDERELCAKAICKWCNENMPFPEPGFSTGLHQKSVGLAFHECRAKAIIERGLK